MAMTVSVGSELLTSSPAEGPFVIFDVIAQFLERCAFAPAAEAIRVQRSEAGGTLSEAFGKELRVLADALVVVLAEVESCPGAVQRKHPQVKEQERILEDTLDSLLRKLMASGQPLSDNTLVSSMDALKTGMQSMSTDKVTDFNELLGSREAEVQAYWEAIQKESKAPEAVQSGGLDAKGAAPVALDVAKGNKSGQAKLPGSRSRGAPTKPEASAQPGAANDGYDMKQFATTNVHANPPEPSAHYVPKKRRGSRDATEEEPDEYQDDDDAGYCVREIFEAELLAELQQKKQKPSESPMMSVASEETRATAGQSQATEFGDIDVIEKIAADVHEKERVVDDDREKPSKKRHKRRHVKYAASDDSFYPVELDGVVLDSFNLRVVFQRDKTGFEVSKELPIRVNSIIAARYQIMEYLGSAAFSRAVQCLDLESNKMVCMKIIKNDKDFLDQSLDEIKLLRYINVNADVDDHCVLRMFDSFYYKEHLIIVTELLRDNLYEFSKFNRDSTEQQPYFTLGHLQKISKQVLTALDYVHSLGLIHCDLKPENILIRSYSRCEVKVIDFGSSCFDDDHLSSYVQSRSYRAPEVMLGLPYDHKIDMWSLGCIIAELWTGFVLFQNDSVQSLLARVTGIIGDFPYAMMSRGRYVPQYFTQDGQLYEEMDAPPCPERGRRLHLLVPKKTSLKQRMRTDCKEFLDFLTKLLKLDPSQRPTAQEALEHPWLTKCTYSDGL